MFHYIKDKKFSYLKPLAGLLIVLSVIAIAPLAKPQSAMAASKPAKCYDDSKTPKFFDCPVTGRTLDRQPIVAFGPYCYVWTEDNNFSPARKGWVKESCNAGVFFHGAVGHNGLPDNSADVSCTLNNGEDPDSCSIFRIYLFPIIDFLAVGIGVLVTIMIVIGGIQYSSARGDPNQVAAAKKKIANALFGLVSFGLLWSFIQWITPGGVF